MRTNRITDKAKQVRLKIEMYLVRLANKIIIRNHMRLIMLKLVSNFKWIKNPKIQILNYDSYIFV